MNVFEKQTLKWMLELCNQENYALPVDIENAYNTDVLMKKGVDYYA